jgi:hypothetical protein
MSTIESSPASGAPIRAPPNRGPEAVIADAAQENRTRLPTEFHSLRNKADDESQDLSSWLMPIVLGSTARKAGTSA